MITLYQNEIETPIIFHTKTNGKIIPLIGSEVYFDFISKATGQRVGGGKCEIQDHTLGMAKYDWKEGELAQLGEYQGQVKIDLTQGATRTALTLEMQIVARPEQSQ